MHVFGKFIRFALQVLFFLRKNLIIKICSNLIVGNFFADFLNFLEGMVNFIFEILFRIVRNIAVA